MVSPTVGTFGSVGTRSFDVTAMTFSRPAFACDADPRIGSMNASMRPPMRSWYAGAEPLYGTTR